MSEAAKSPAVELEPSVPKPFDWPLLTWNDSVKTGKVCAGLIFSLVLVKYVNLLSLFFHLATYILAASAFAEVLGKFVTGRGFVTRYRPKEFSTTFSTKTLQYLKVIEAELPNFESNVQKLVYAVDIEKTFKLSAVTYILFQVTSLLNLYRLLFFSTITAFTLPYVYDRYHAEATEYIHLFAKEATIKAKEQWKALQEKSKPLLEKAQSSLGPVSQFIQSTYQTRTASSTVSKTPEDVTKSDATVESVAVSSGSQVADASFSEEQPIASAHEFPEVPETTPLMHESDSDEKADVAVSAEKAHSDVIAF